MIPAIGTLSLLAATVGLFLTTVRLRKRVVVPAPRPAATSTERPERRAA